MKQILLITFSALAFGLSAQVSPIQLGGASDILDSRSWLGPILPQQNMVFACDSLGLVAFLHRQDITIWGGGATQSGKFRCDISIDEGQTFSNDIGDFQTVYTNYGKTPQLVGFNPSGTQNPLDAKLVWTGHTDRFPTPGIVGMVAGVSDVSTSTISSTEHYIDPSNPHVLGGLCQGMAGEFWLAEQHYDGTNFMDSIRIMKGVYNTVSQDVDWTIYQNVYIPYNTNFDGTIYSTVPNIAFSPDGMIGWIVFLGDLVGGVDSVYTPIFMKTTNGGLTWSAPMEIDLSQFSHITDSFTLAPQYVGMENPGTDSEFDISVDINGNLHCFTHVMASIGYERTDYASGIVPWHAMFDITTTNGGSTWEAKQIATAYTFDKDINTTGAPVLMRLQPQISRTEEGDYMFYCWVDSDTALLSGSMNGIGYGETKNLAPNLRIAGLDIAINTILSVKGITNGDIMWDGLALYPTMAPTVIYRNNQFHLPIVMLELLQNDATLPCRYWYFGNDAYFDNPVNSIKEIESATNFSLFPNPVTDKLCIKTMLPATPLSVDILSLDGKLLQQQEFEPNAAIELNIGALPLGLYYARISSNGKELESLKFVKG